MKKILAVAIIVLIIIIVFLSMSSIQHMVVVQTNNVEKKPLKIELGRFQDSDCGMVIDKITYASQVISSDGKTWFFHDHGGMIHWLENKSFKNNVVIWVYAKDTKKWIYAKNAWYSRNDITPMNYGFGAYEKNDSKKIDFVQMRLFMLRGETMANPSTRKFLFRR